MDLDPIDDHVDPVLQEHLEGAKRLSKLRRQLELTQGYRSSSPAEPSLPRTIERKRKERNDDGVDLDNVTGAASPGPDSSLRPPKILSPESVRQGIFDGTFLETSGTSCEADLEDDRPAWLNTQREVVEPVKTAQLHDRTSRLGSLENQPQASLQSTTLSVSQTATNDPMIFPGLYAPSGFDMMSILIRVMKRPNPRIDIGFVDSSCALVLCSLPAQDQPSDTPIVYCSDAFSSLTEYPMSEILGRNCRFLQSPDGNVLQGSKRKHTDGNAVYDMKQGLRKGEETQTCLANYKKSGQKFLNLLTTVEIEWGGDKGRYIVGFQAEYRAG